MKCQRKKTPKKDTKSKTKLSLCTAKKEKFRVVDLIQKSKEWQKWRSEGIGGSDQLKIRSLRSTETVLKKKFGIHEPLTKYEEAERLKKAQIILENDTKGICCRMVGQDSP